MDLFAGSGGLGLEALSRGLDKVIFIDRDAKAIQTIHENIQACKMEDKAEVYRNDADRALKALIKREICFDYIFLDPPYKKQQLISLMQKISENKLLNMDGYIICEHGHDVRITRKSWRILQTKHEKYGIIAITIYSYFSEE